MDLDGTGREGVRAGRGETRQDGTGQGGTRGKPAEDGAIRGKKRQGSDS